MSELLIVDVKNYKGHIKTIFYDGVDSLSPDKTIDDFLTEGFSALTWAEYEVIREKWLDSLCGDWEEVTEDRYEYALNVLPPRKWYDGGFFVGEMYDADVGNFYQQVGDRYFTSRQRLSYRRDDILEELQQFIKALDQG